MRSLHQNMHWTWSMLVKIDDAISSTSMFVKIDDYSRLIMLQCELPNQLIQTTGWGTPFKVKIVSHLQHGTSGIFCTALPSWPRATKDRTNQAGFGLLGVLRFYRRDFEIRHIGISHVFLAWNGNPAAASEKALGGGGPKLANWTTSNR